MQNQTSLQETTIKEETEGLGIEYTNYSPDYSLYQRDYVATGESEPVETGRSRYRIHRWCFQGEKPTFGEGLLLFEKSSNVPKCWHLAFYRHSNRTFFWRMVQQITKLFAFFCFEN